MFGPMAGQFWGGYMQEGDRIERRRLDFSKAFNEFRRDNPYATIDDLQGQINSIYGGQNFLYGAPSRPVLDSIAQQNQTRLQERQSVQQIEQLQRQANLQKSVLDTVRSIVPNARNDAEALDTARNMFGNNQLVQGMITPEMITGIRTEAQRNFINDPRNREAAIGALRGNRDLSEAFPGIPSHMLQGLQDMARSEVTRQDDDRRRNQRVLSMQEMDIALKSGQREFNPNTGFQDLDAEVSRSFAERRRTTDGQLVNTEADELSKDQAIQSQLLAGQRDEVRAMMSRRLQTRIGRPPTDDEVTAGMDRVIAGARQLQASSIATTRTALDGQAANMAKAEFEQRQGGGSALMQTDAQRNALFGSQATPRNANVARVVQALHERYAFSGQEIQAIAAWSKTSAGQALLGAQPTEVTITQALREQFPDLLSRGDRAQQEVTRRTELRRQAGVDIPQTRVEDFLRETTTNVTAGGERATGALRSELDKIGQMAPDKALERLTMIERQTRAQSDAFDAQLRQRLQTQQTWRDPSGRSLTGQDIDPLVQQNLQNRTTLLALIEDARRGVAARAGAQGTRDMSTQPGAGPNNAQPGDAFRINQQRRTDAMTNAIPLLEQQRLEAVRSGDMETALVLERLIARQQRQ